MLKRLIIALTLILAWPAHAGARYMISCQKTDSVDPVTDMFTNCGQKWQRLTKGSRARLKKAPINTWTTVRTTSGASISCMVRYKTDTLCGGEKPVAAKAIKTSPPKRGYRPATGKPAVISPEKITVSERMKLYATYINDAAAKYRIPRSFIKGVIRVESNFNYRAKSPVGAMGLMQLMPRTAKALGVSDPWDPRQNIMGGTKFLRRLANKYKGDMVRVLSAYNAGPGAVAKKDGTIPFAGAERYVRAVLKHYYAFKDEEADLTAP